MEGLFHPKEKRNCLPGWTKKTAFVQSIKQYINKEIENQHLNPEKPDVPLNKNDAFQKVQKRRVQEKR